MNATAITFKFERKKYEGSAITPEIKQAIYNRVRKIDDHILRFDEIPVCSTETIKLMFERTNELLSLFDEKCGIIIDVSDTDVPESEVRRTINQGFRNICDQVSHVAFVTGKKKLFNTLLKFIMFQTNLDSFSINGTFEEGIKQIKNNLSV